jgi:hypothetical protein
VTAGEQDTAVIDQAWRSAGRVEVRDGRGDEGASAGWALNGGAGIGDFGVALLADPRHKLRIYFRGTLYVCD